MIKILQVRNIDSFVESRRQKTSEKDRKIVQSILNDVRKNGDSAVRKYERKFNGRKTSQLRVSAKETKEAQYKISNQEREAIVSMRLGLSLQESEYLKILPSYKYEGDDYRITKSFTPIPSVGCYIPGGQARYPSSAVMSITPAKLAGVKRIVVVSPPGRDGKIDPLTITAAKSYAGLPRFTRLAVHKQLAHWRMEQNPYPKLIKFLDQEENLSALQNHLSVIKLQLT